MAKLPRTFPAPGGCPVIPSGRSHSCISFCVTDTVRTSLCIPTKKTYFMEETSERAAETNSWRAPVPWAPSRCSRAMELPQLQFAENWSRTSGLELRSSLEAGMRSRCSLPNPRSTVLLAVAPYHSSAAADSTSSVDSKRKSCLGLPFHTSVSKWHL